MSNELQSKKDWNVGDQTTIPLTGMGEFTATAHKVTDTATLFIFDDYVAQRQMNEKNTNEGSYNASDLKKWIESDLLNAFPEWLRNDIFGLSIPTVGELFGHGNDWNSDTFELDNDEQLELMKLRKNRVAYFNNECEWGWLRNATKKEVSSAGFAFVNYLGSAACYNASHSYGVRPEFWLVKKTEGSCAPRTTTKVTYKSSESLLNDISKKESEIQEMREEMKRLERIKSYDVVANETKDMVDSFCKVGFTLDQAIAIVTTVIGVNMKNM